MGSDLRPWKDYLQPITHVAIMEPDGTIHSLPEPNRHSDVIRGAFAKGKAVTSEWEQGFLLADGTFVRRAPAARIALETGQVKVLAHPPKLYSEDLW